MDANEGNQERKYQAEAYPEETKIAIAARLMAGEKPVDLAAEYSISLPTISRIKRKYINADMLSKMEEEKAGILGDLLMINLEMSLTGMANIAGQTNDRGWMFAQNAGDLGKMYGIMSDKTVRIMESMDAARQTDIQDFTDGSESQA